ncbi:unnamed protein product, partial [Allacma fusca]
CLKLGNKVTDTPCKLFLITEHMRNVLNAMNSLFHWLGYGFTIVMTVFAKHAFGVSFWKTVEIPLLNVPGKIVTNLYFCRKLRRCYRKQRIVSPSNESRVGSFSPHVVEPVQNFSRSTNSMDAKVAWPSPSRIVNQQSQNWEKTELSGPLDIAFNREPCDCEFCGLKLNFGKGILLQACLHVFCRECLREAVMGSSGGPVPCPNQCGQKLYEREIKAVVSQDEYERFSKRQILTATQELPIFLCKTRNCDGICIPENDAKIFLCSICNRQNCLSCGTIHDGIPCDRWKKLRLEADRSGSKLTDEELLAKSEDFGYKHISRTVQELLQGFPDDDLALYYEAAANIFEESTVVPTVQDFECLICTNMTSDVETGGGFLLQQCGHAFCKSCLQSIVNLAEEMPVPCPYDGEGGRCKGFMSAAEFKTLASETVFEKHIRWGWSVAADILQKKFRCLERTCAGFWEIEDKVPTGIYICPVCRSENCVNCNTIHPTETCAELQEKLRKEAELIKDEENRRVQQENEKTGELEVNKLINNKQFMRCPYCGFVCEKISGCAHVVCLNRACKQKFNWLLVVRTVSTPAVLILNMVPFAAYQASEIEGQILKKVVSNLNSLGIRQYLFPQETLSHVTKKLGCRDPLYVTKQKAVPPGDCWNFVVTCIVGTNHVSGESCDESRAIELAACTMLVRLLLKVILENDSSECPEDPAKDFRYLNLGFRLDTAMNFQSIEHLQVPLEEDSPKKVIKICHRARESQTEERMSSKEFCSKYKIQRRIDTGSFGVVMMGTALKNNELVALKFESGTNRHSKLLYEQEATRRLNAGGATVPPVLDFFRYKTHLVQVMPFLGPSLEMMYQRFRPFCFDTVRKLGHQMIRCIQSIHTVGFIHRDIKPGNFVLDYHQKVWIIDLGLSKPFGCEDEAKIYSPLDQREKLPNLPFSRVGTRRYCTLRSHMGVNQNYQDDLIALGYTLAYFLKGRVPWKGLQSEEDVERMKREMEQHNYLELYQDLPHPANEMLRTYFNSVLQNRSENYQDNYYCNTEQHKSESEWRDYKSREIRFRRRASIPADDAKGRRPPTTSVLSRVSVICSKKYLAGPAWTLLILINSSFFEFPPSEAAICTYLSWEGWKSKA